MTRRDLEPHEPGLAASVALLLLLIPITAALGGAVISVTVAGVSLYPFKVVVPVLVLLLLRPALRTMVQDQSIAALVLLAGWATVSSVWAPSLSSSLQESSILAFAALLAAGLVVAVSRPIGVRALLRGWIAAVLSTGAVGVAEQVTGRHLRSDFITLRGDSAGTVLATFGNPNNFGAFLVLAVPFVAIVALGLGSHWRMTAADRVAAVIALALAIPVLVLTASRFAIVGLACAFGVYCVANIRWRSTVAYVTLAATAAVALVAFAVSSGLPVVDKFGQVFTRTPVGGETSRDIRVNLFLDGLAFTARSSGLGLGGGSFEAEMASGTAPFPLQRTDVVNPHNFWIEMLSQYGIIGLGLACFALSVALRRAWSVWQRGPTPSLRRAASLLLAGLAGYAFAALAPSSFLSDPVNWVFVGSALAMGRALQTAARRLDMPRRPVGFDRQLSG